MILVYHSHGDAYGRPFKRRVSSTMVFFVITALLGCTPRDDRCPVGPTATVCAGTTALTCEDERLIDETPCGAGDLCVDGAGCTACEISLPERAVVPIDRDEGTEAWRTLAWSAIPLEGAGQATVSVTGPFTLHGADGQELVGPVVLPGFVYVRGTGGGTGELTASLDGCDATSRMPLDARRMPGLSAVQVPVAPTVSYVDAFPMGSTLRVALDPSRYPQLHDQEVSIYVVADRDREAWLDDPTLEDLGTGPVQLIVNPNGLQGNFEPVWTDLPTGDGVVGHFDLVVDVDGDGQLSPGDLLDGLQGPGFAIFPDLTAPGTHAVRTSDVSSTFMRTQRIWWPEDLASFDSAAPLVVISHGNGHEYTWYDYLGAHLASWGYVVMSHRNDTGPGVEAAAQTTLDNTNFFLVNRTTVDPDLANVDPGRVALIGHSRGAEGVVIAYERLRTGTSGTSILDAASIQLISSIAPTVFSSPNRARASEIPFHILSGAADGDVTGGVADPNLPFFGCSLCQSWRLLQGSEGPQAVSYLHGAIHNDFNCCGFNDGQNVSAPKIGRDPAQAYTRALYVALLGHFVQDEPIWQEYLTRMPDDLPLPSPAPVATQFRVAMAEGHFIEDFQTAGDPLLSSSGTEVRFTVDDYTEGALDDADMSFASDGAGPMNGMTQSDSDGALASRGAVFSWTDDASWEVDLPEDLRDLTGPRFLAMSIAQATRHPLTTELDDTIAFGVALIDADGVESVLETAAFGRVTAPYPRQGTGAGTGWANEFNTVRFRLTDFETGGIDLSDVRTIRLRFGIGYGSPRGRIGFDDLVLED